MVPGKPKYQQSCHSLDNTAILYNAVDHSGDSNFRLKPTYSPWDSIVKHFLSKTGQACPLLEIESISRMVKPLVQSLPLCYDW